jgi:hypothetical protein
MRGSSLADERNPDLGDDQNGVLEALQILLKGEVRQR